MFRQPVSRQTADLISLPSPIGGLNVVDSLSAMPPTDAIVMSNVIAQPYGVQVRKGYMEHAVGLGGPVNTVASLASRDGSHRLYGWSGDALYDATAVGPVGAPLLTGLTTPWWQYVSMGNSAGTHLIAMSGDDDPIWIHNNGASVDRLTAGDGIVSGTWSGVDPINLIQCTVHQRRLWAVQVDTTLGWFLPPDSVYGVAQFFDFGPFFKLGGYLQALATWTVDAGQGSDDKLVAISSRGEAVVFAGVDVTDPTAWSLVGVYFVGAPVRGRRFYTNMAGDLYLMTNTGVVSMATVITSTQVNVAANSAYSRKIQFLLSDLTSTLGNLDGWQIESFPSINLVYINVPSVYFGGAGQVVANSINQTWCLFTGMDAVSWARVNGDPFFGDPNGKIYRSWVADTDKIAYDGTGGTNILSQCQQAYNYFGKPAVQKQVGMYRPNLSVVKPISFNSRIAYDFQQSSNTFPSGVVPSPGGAALWGIAIWGANYWSGGLQTQREWRMGSGLGVAASLEIGFSTDSQTIWVSTDLSVKSGGLL